MVLMHGDCLTELAQVDHESIDACVTDPPYGIGFAGNRWDRFQVDEFERFTTDWGQEVLRVLRPGGYVLAFGADTTIARVAYSLETVGFIPLGLFLWAYGTGVPKSKHDLKPAYEPAFIGRKPPFVEEPWTRAAAKYFYCEKPSLDELEAGCDDLPARQKTTFGVGKILRRNPHPTVKARQVDAIAGPPRLPRGRNGTGRVHGQRYHRHGVRLRGPGVYGD